MSAPENPFLGFDMPATPDGNIAAVNPAAWMYERLARAISDFESRLDDDHEIGIRLGGAAPADIFRVEDIGFWGPDLLIFHGRTGNDEPFRSMQHISQLNIQLVGVKKTAEEPRRIGFVLIDKIDKDAS